MFVHCDCSVLSVEPVDGTRIWVHIAALVTVHENVSVPPDPPELLVPPLLLPPPPPLVSFVQASIAMSVKRSAPNVETVLMVGDDTP